MNAYIYLEGGSVESKDADIRCREGFRKLLEKCGFTGRMPRLVACGGRNDVFGQFRLAHRTTHGPNFVAMWIDSEEPLSNVEAAWAHLLEHDRWAQPPRAVDEQVLFMTTCMETWFVADRAALKTYFKHNLQESALPSLHGLENRDRHEVQHKLGDATRNCSNAYVKGIKSYDLLGKLSPAILEQHLPSFVRIRRILTEHL